MRKRDKEAGRAATHCVDYPIPYSLILDRSMVFAHGSPAYQVAQHGHTGRRRRPLDLTSGRTPNLACDIPCA